MSNHHRSSHHSRSRVHHSSSASRYQRARSNRASRDLQPQVPDWSEHRSSSGKVYYYNVKTGVSQWEVPAELRQRTPESEISESSSIRQQDNSTSSSASPTESAPDDKPILTPSLEQYYKPELIADLNSSHIEELERRANQLSRDSFFLNERILKESVDLKMAKAIVHYIETSIEAQEKKCSLIRQAIERIIN